MKALRQPINIALIQDLVLFFVVLLGVHNIVKLFLVSVAAPFGLEIVVVDQFLSDNELVIQVVALALANWVLLKWAKTLKAPEQSLRHYFRSTQHSVYSLSSMSVFQGFLVVSLAVGISLFMGLSAIEAPRFNLQGLWLMVPTLLFQIALFGLWFALLEWNRINLSRLLMLNRQRDVPSRVLMIGLEAYLYFSILKTNSLDSQAQLLVALVCLLLAATSFFWFEYDEAFARNRRVARFQRVGFQLGFWIPLIHIYGQSIGSLNGLSLMHLYEGPLKLSHFMGGALSLPQLFYIVLLVFLGNALLQRLLRRMTHSA